MLADLLTRAVPPWARWLALAAVAAALYGTGRVHQARVDHAEQVAEQAPGRSAGQITGTDTGQEVPR